MKHRDVRRGQARAAHRKPARQRPNPRLAKIHRSYTVDEVARLFGLHKNSVRQWIKKGLPVIGGKRPVLIHGRDLRSFLEARRQQHKRTCQPGQIYCMRCRAPKRPATDWAEYKPLNETLGNLVGFCPDCDDHEPWREPGETRTGARLARHHVPAGTSAHRGKP